MHQLLHSLNAHSVARGRVMQRWIHSGQTMTTQEVANALRPFIFSVHPDRFWNHPKEKVTNEVSLKRLNEFIGDKLNSKSVCNQETITFYMRHNKVQSPDTRLQKVDIVLKSGENINTTVHRILSQCSLPTDYLAKIGKQPPVQSKQTLPKSSGVKNNKTNDYFYSKELFDEFEERIIKSKVELNLTEWLKRNYSVALQKLEAIQPIQDELRRLKDELVEELQLEDLRWNCDWSVSHIRGCLTNLSVLNKQYPDDLNRLQAKTVIFSRHNCIDLNGQVILNIEDVRNSWLDLIRSIKTYDTYLESLPVAEKTLSDLLRGISIVHPQYNLWSVKKYFKQLRRLIDSVVEYKRQQGLPSNWPRSLGHHRLIVEFDSGPLMLSPCGHFIVPASCPVSLLVRFISENLLKASHSLERDRRCSEEERRVRDECVVAFGLKCLDKDENITAEQMIEFGGRLLGERDQLRPYLLATHLRVSHYYSVLHDGQICVPYNFTP